MSDPSPETQPPKPPAPRFLAHYFCFLPALLIPAGIFAYLFIYRIPAFPTYYKDQKTSLPQITQFALFIAGPLASWLIWIPILLLAAALPALFARQTSRLPASIAPLRLSRDVWMLVSLSLFLFLFLAIALLYPAIYLVNGQWPQTP